MFRKISKFTVSPLGSGGALTMNATIEASANAEWWQQLPWESIALWFFIFWLGTIYADLMSEKSDIKEWINGKLRVFDVVAITPSSSPPDKSENTIIPRIKIRFRKNVKSNIRISVDTLALNYCYIRKFTSEITGKKEFQCDDEFVFDLATIYKESHKNPFWQCIDDRGENQSFLKHSQNIVTVTIGKQEYKIYIKHFDQGAGEQGICFLLGEDQDIWGKGNERT